MRAVSLVHESLVSVLNRRFVNCYYNSFPWVGHDEGAAAFAKKAEAGGKRLNYGAIFTPDGEMVVSFGFDMHEFYRSLKKAIAEHPELTQPSDQEKRAFERARAKPQDVAAQLAAARLHSELLNFDKARKLLDRVIEAKHGTDEDLARARYLRGHIALLDPDNHDRATVKKALANIEHLPADLADDVAVDRIAADVELRPGGGFFTGWRFVKDRDLPATITELDSWTERAPDSNRIGQMLFLLGLAKMNAGEPKAADAVWERHFSEYPEDRFAMLSRLHHTGYQFSPYGSGRFVFRSSVGSDGIIKIDGGNFDGMDEDMKAALLEQVRKALKEGKGSSTGFRITTTTSKSKEESKEETKETPKKKGGGSSGEEAGAAGSKGNGGV